MKKLLPLGSVVLLEGVKKRVMIYGRLQKKIGETEEIFDYIGCPYPEGNISPSESILFNENQIKMVFFLGFQDLEELMFKEKLQKLHEESKTE